MYLISSFLFAVNVEATVISYFFNCLSDCPLIMEVLFFLLHYYVFSMFISSGLIVRCLQNS